jgi:superfamily II DNA or RNA helicase
MEGSAMATPEIADLTALVGRRVSLPGHFDDLVDIEAVRPLGAHYEMRVRRANGQLEEAVLSAGELATITASAPAAPHTTAVDAEQLRLLVESTRIRLAYSYDRRFAVSLSGIRTLPHQIEAVYLKMLPQPRLRFLLADDPGAGKTIMAGLLLKELKLRQAIERTLIVVPAPLTIQWQDELLRFFGEAFQIIHSANDQQQLINLWQRENQIIVSLDYAKQEDVRERIWQQRWDLVIIDEAHKCAARTKGSSDRAPEVDATRRYQLAQKLSAEAEHLLLLTATPHNGDDDQFAHFLRLLDPDIFPEPHRLADQAKAIRRNVLSLGPDCPWALRRLKEDLRDLNGRRLFPDRHPQTVTFELNVDEYALYKSVTAFINQFLPQGQGRQKHSVALTRTVLQRRLASSTNAVAESLRRRFDKQRKILDDLEALPPSQRARYLDRLRGRLTDAEQDDDDVDDATSDHLADEYTAADEMDQIRAEVAALRDLVERARTVRDLGNDSKLAALRSCLQRAQFDELKDGRGKLLIFTEHRDTLTYLRGHLDRWGYTTVEIHGSLNPQERRRAQEAFRTQKQVCVATEAAGEGINLQFCHLMINYDLPWNPTRLEQRLGRIHRIGQERDVYVFNFVADRSQDGQPVIEGSILKRLLEKLETMREALGHDRVFDVVGQVLALNDVNLAEMLRDAAYDPRRLEEYLDQIDRIDPQRLRQYEEATGIALARGHVDFSAFQRSNFEAEEKRLMPEYVAKQFLASAQQVGMRVEPRADGLWRVEHVPADLRSDRLEAVRRLGRAEPAYRKMTFHKDVLDQDQNVDAVLVGPGHPLYSALDERLNERLANIRGGVAAFVDADASEPYLIHFLEFEIRGEPASERGQTVLHAELVAVRERHGSFSLLPSDVLHDLAPPAQPAQNLPTPDPQAAIDFVKSTCQLEQRVRVLEERRHYTEVVRDYLTRSFDARIRAGEGRVMSLRAREEDGHPEVSLARQRAESDLADLRRTRTLRLGALERLAIVRTGPVRHLVTVVAFPPGETVIDLPPSPRLLEDETTKRETELAAMRIVQEHERQRGWEWEDVSIRYLGFDIRSLGPPDPATGQRAVRRIEVKGRKRGQPLRLTTNEWLKARQLRETYWLYVVWDPLDENSAPLLIQNPGFVLEHAIREVRDISHYELPAAAVERAAGRGGT